ncbi:alpha/beta hydrolase [Pseudomonas sp. S32]|uniref:alpha/beta hydrolase n=1 Tax=Pseudomonas sp. S32 TaxID=2767448 RepID=UPI001F32DA8F|nr:alpha/beta hydrolase [Pseudomonas sp. S32]MBK5003480.1 ymc-like protein [Pseudomonas sp. S32]
MKPVDIVTLVRSTWDNTLPAQRLAQLQVVRRGVPDEHLELFESLIDMQVASIKDSTEVITLMLVHGIQTDGAWHELVEAAFRDVAYVRVKPIGYNCVTAAQLACPFRSAPINHVVQQFRDAQTMEPTARVMVIAHSFGTYIISHILSKFSDIKIERVVLCGSIISNSYPWDLHTRHMAAGNILNDVGTRDLYPVLASVSTLGYGGSGRNGFKNTRVTDRFFNYGHSDFFVPDNDHIARYWKPYIIDGTVIESEWDTQKPKTPLGIMMACHPWIGRPIFAVIAASLLGGAALGVLSLFS